MSHHLDLRLAWRAGRTLQMLERVGVALRVDRCPQCNAPHRLVAFGSASTLTDEMRDWIRRDKELLIEIVYRRDALAEAEELVTHG